MLTRRIVALGFLVIAVTAATMGVVYAAISNGASAIDLLGQYDDSLTAPEPVYTKSAANDGPNKLGYNAVFGNPVIDPERDRLFVPDVGNNRILVYNLDSAHALEDRIPDYVLGQSNFYTNATSPVSAASLSSPRGLAYDAENDRLFVADLSNNRVLVFDVSNISSGMDAEYVLGQSSFTDNTATTTQSGMSGPWRVTYDGTGGLLYVGDTTNNRVLVFSGSIATGMDAWRVLGQSSFTASSAATTQSGLSSPRGIAFGSGYVFVADRSNSRVLAYTGSELSNGMNATIVLGQTSFTGGGGTVSQSRMNSPDDVLYDNAGKRLFVSDTNNNRILVFTGSMLSNGVNAAKVIGQTTFTAASATTTQASVNNPRSVFFDAQTSRLYVGQNTPSRVSIFDVASITNGESAVDLLGQYDDDDADPQPVYTKSAANNGPNKRGLSISSSLIPQNLAHDPNNHRLFVADATNNRVLVYNLSATDALTDHVPDFVLGQANFYTNTARTTQSGFSLPVGVAYDAGGDRLFVVERTNNRVLVFSGASLSTGMLANHVIGQTSYTVGTAGTTQSKFAGPAGVAYDDTGDRLFITDTSAHRVLVFSGASVGNGMNAAKVLGQATFTASSSATTATGLNAPYGVAINEAGQQLFIADRTNSRVVVYDITTIDDGESAVNVLGQADFTSSSTATTAAGMNLPRGLSFDTDYGRLFVADLSNNRVLSYAIGTMSDGADASNVLGQSNFTTSTFPTTPSAINSANPASVLAIPGTGKLYVGEAGGFNRIKVYDVLPASSSSSSSSSTAASGAGGGSRRGIQSLIDQAASYFGGSSSASSESSEPTSEETERRFRDVPLSAWFYEFVEKIASLGIISGYADLDGNALGIFGPADPVTVGQTMKIALLAGGHDLPVPSGVPQNPTATDWSAPYIALGETLGITLASADTARTATRGDVIRALLEAFDITIEETSHPFTDLPPAHPHATAIATAYRLGIVTGDTDADGNLLNTVRPDDTINRAETAALAVRMLERL